ncbi:MAG TPA: hypothetical protein VFI73_05565 [Candidatus Nitrosopolaris sp.]|nr:hypothetical protein [Candidatus Nitrosopolaris sp.]
MAEQSRKGFYKIINGTLLTENGASTQSAPSYGDRMHIGIIKAEKHFRLYQRI